MKRCPKCNRTFPDENQKFCTFDGGLLISSPAFDPNMTIRATAADVEVSTETWTDPGTSRELPKHEHGATSRDLPRFDETIAASAPTAFFPRDTGVTGKNTSAELANTPPPSAPPGAVTTGPIPPATSLPLGAKAAARPAPKKKSKLPWILAAVLLLLILGGAGIAAVIFVALPRIQQLTQSRSEGEKPPAPAPAPPTTNTNSETKPPEPTKAEVDTFVPPADATKFTNSRDNLDGKLAEHYVDFSFYFPGSWQTDPKAGVAGASNFARIFKTVKEGADEYTPESVAVSWYSSNGSYDADIPIFPDRVEALSTQLSKGLPNYKKVSEGPTQVNSLKGYDFHFTGVFKDAEQELRYWGRAIFVPPVKSGEKNGVTIIMLVTAKSTDVHNEDEVGVKGEIPLVLESFRFGKKD